MTTTPSRGWPDRQLRDLWLRSMRAWDRLLEEIAEMGVVDFDESAVD